MAAPGEQAVGGYWCGTTSLQRHRSLYCHLGMAAGPRAPPRGRYQGVRLRYGEPLCAWTPVDMDAQGVCRRGSAGLMR